MSGRGEFGSRGVLWERCAVLRSDSRIAFGLGLSVSCSGRVGTKVDFGLGCVGVGSDTGAVSIRVMVDSLEVKSALGSGSRMIPLTKISRSRKCSSMDRMM